MRRLTLALVLMFTILVQASMAAQLGNPVRDANRQFLIAEAKGTYDPAALVQVTTGDGGTFVTATMTAAQALERQLDFLQSEGISLLTEASAPASTPSWPLNGRLTFHEVGWVDKVGTDATCPQITLLPPPSPTQDPIADAYRDIFGQDPPADVGEFTSDVSEYWSSPYGGQTSWIKHDPIVGDEQTYYYGQAGEEGWTVRAGYIIEDGNQDGKFFCVGPSGSFGVVRLDAIVTPYADRVD